MSAHKDHHHVAVTLDADPAPPVVVWFRWRWQAWLTSRLLDRAVGGHR